MVSIVIFFIVFVTVSGSIEDLEQRVEKLEEDFGKLEEAIVFDYGLVKRCRLQTVENGKSVCRFKGKAINYHYSVDVRLCHSDLKPGVECKARCNSGWIPTPGPLLSLFYILEIKFTIYTGHQFSKCQIGGFWNVELKCETPLLIVAGGFQVE